MWERCKSGFRNQEEYIVFSETSSAIPPSDDCTNFATHITFCEFTTHYGIHWKLGNKMSLQRLYDSTNNDHMCWMEDKHFTVQPELSIHRYIIENRTFNSFFILKRRIVSMIGFYYIFQNRYETTIFNKRSIIKQTINNRTH